MLPPPPGWIPRRLPQLVLVAVAVVYAPSLGGGFVWDDRVQVADNPELRSLTGLVATDIRGGLLPESNTIYRPLAMATHALVQAVAPGPAAERALSLGLFLGVVAAVARLGRHAGASRTAAWLAALLLGVHTGPSEAVAWISGRHDLLPTLLTLLAWILVLEPLPDASGPAPRSLVDVRAVGAGLLLAATPFAKESWLAIPAATLLLWPLAGRRVLLPAAIGAVGTLLDLWVRARIGEVLPTGDAAATPLAALGGVVVRGFTLLVVPASADAVAPLRAAPLAGVLSVAAALLLTAATRRRPGLSVGLAGATLLVPAAVASWRFGLVGDRYFLFPFAAAAASAAPLLEPRVARIAAVLIAPLLGLSTALRAREWGSDLAVFGASHALHPELPQAAFRYGAALQAAGRCPDALEPLGLAIDAEPAAVPYLQVCLLAVGRYTDVVALAPRTRSATGSRAVAQAYTLTGDLASAETWARKATELDPDGLPGWVLLGNVLGQEGRFGEAAQAFAAAVGLDPSDGTARAGLDAARRHLVSP